MTEGTPDPAQLAQVNQLQAEYMKGLKDQIEAQQKILELQGKETSAYSAALARLQAITKERQELIRLYQSGATVLGEEAQRIQAMLDYDKERGRLTQEEVANLQRKLGIIQQISGMSESIRAQQARLLSSQVQSTIELGKQQAAFQGLASKLGGLVGIGTNFNQTVLGGMANAVGGIAGQLANILGSYRSIGSLAGPSVAVANKAMGFWASATEQLMVTQDGLRAKFMSATGASERFGSSVIQSSTALQKLALDARAAGAAATALYNGMTMFKGASESARTELTVFAAKLSEAGVDVRSTTSYLQTMTQTLGMGRQQAIQATSSFVNLAQSLQLNVNAALQQANQLMPQLAKYGQRATTVLAGLAAQSRASGLAMDTLFGVAAKFDTFESAANAVGRLNGILGGPYLNSIQMVYASEEKRLSLLHQTLQASGRSWDSLKRFERQAFATAAGFKSVGDAGNFFRNSLSNATTEMNKARVQQEKLENAGRRMKPIADRLRLSFMTLATSMEPLLNKLIGLIDGFARFAATTEGQTVMKTMMAVGAFVKLTTTINAVAMAMRAMALGAVGLNGGLMALAVGGIAMLYHNMVEKRSSPNLVEGTQRLAGGLQQLGGAAASASANISRSGLIPQLSSLASTMKSVGSATKNLVFGMEVSGYEDVMRATERLAEVGPAARATVGTFSQMVHTTKTVDASDSLRAREISRAAENYAKASIRVHQEGSNSIIRYMIEAKREGGGGGGGGGGQPQKVYNQPINFNVGDRAFASHVLNIVNDQGNVKISPG
jgi:hypothetical protein